ncbi:KdsC family phosphatase [Sphingorhabdus sp.]|uniref:KdsC family phosphatase n=1 Tax=Sphingorhabdus sp. TaxID=1902408 RepID=UPI0035B25245
MSSVVDDRALAAVRLVVFDFDGVFTDNTVYVSQDGVESVRCWRSDGLGLARLKALGVHLFIVSTEQNPVVTARANKLKLACRQGVDDKACAIREISAELGVALKHVMFVGNDINDIPALRSIGIPVVVADAYPEAAQHARLQTRKAGGYGAVREVCDLIFEARTNKKADSLS